MGMVKKILSFLGMVFDIRDLAGFIKRLFGFGGTASVLTSIYNYLADNVSMLSLILFGIGIFCVLLATFPHIFNFIKRRLGIMPEKKTQTVPIPNEDIRILNIARLLRQNPCRHLLVTERIVHEWHLEGSRPHITLQVSYTNIGLYDLQFGRPEGFAWWQGDRLPERIQDDGGRNNVPVEVSSFTRFDIYVPQDFIEDVHREISSDTGELKSLNLQQVTANVWVMGDSEPHRWSLQPPNGTFFKRRQ